MAGRKMVIDGITFEEISSFCIPPLLGDEFVCQSFGDGIYLSLSIKKVLSPLTDNFVDNTNNKFIFTGTKTPKGNFSIVSVSFDKMDNVLLFDVFESYCKIFKKNFNNIVLSQNQISYYFVNDINSSINQSIFLLAKSDEREESKNDFIVFNGINKGEKSIRVETLNNKITFIKDKKISNPEYFIIVPN